MKYHDPSRKQQESNDSLVFPDYQGIAPYFTIGAVIGKDMNFPNREYGKPEERTRGLGSHKY
jgi:hypothetical protein